MDRYGFTTVDQVAEVLLLSRHTVIRLLEAGELPGVRLGRRWRLPVLALAERVECDPEEFLQNETSVTHGYQGPSIDADGTEAVA